MKQVVELLLRFFQVGLFSIGGGYATLPLIQQQVVENTGWLTLQEFTDIVTISQMTPGPLAVNAPTFVGMRIAGLPGALVATLGCVISGVVISSAMQRMFTRSKSLVAADALKALRSASAGLIVSAAATILLLALFGSEQPALGTLNVLSLGIAAACFLFLRWKKPNTLLVMAASGVLGLLYLL